MANRECKVEVRQARNVTQPWYLFLTFHKVRQRVNLDCDIVAEWIPTPSKTFKLAGMLVNKVDDVSKTISLINKVCTTYDHPFNSNDEQQIREIIADTKNNLKKKEVN